MAIGHEPEVGVAFGTFERDEYGFLVEDAMLHFYRGWKARVGDDLTGGWATLIRSDRNAQSQLKRSPSARYKGQIPQTQVPLRCLYTPIDRGDYGASVAVSSSGDGGVAEAGA